ncbi:MAG: N-acetylmuramoyl-L-alanine amidase [Ferruginibacter sp.]|nr:N-acetylmuramoyl-L-alanine amidase [Ferruginibacter sp.]
MLPFLFYILKVIICSAILFGYYWFLLRNKVFHTYNRYYLLMVIILSILLPLCQISVLHKPHVANKSVIKMLQVVTTSNNYMEEIIIGEKQTGSNYFIQILPFIYGLISVVFLGMLLQMFFKIYILYKSHKKQIVNNIFLIQTNAAKGTPFSFFNYIFWNNEIDINSEDGNRIFAHELSHVNAKHSYDKLLVNLVLIVLWSNPFFWLIRKELSMIHEFVADKNAVKDGNTKEFALMILATTFPKYNNIITNNFFYSPIKRRLMMLTKNKHHKMNYFSRIVALPLLAITFTAFAVKVKKMNNIDNIEKPTTKIINTVTTKQITVVLDAGHGGVDNGGVYNGIFEKDLALQLIKKINSLNTNTNVKIIMTRNIDIYQSPQEKVAFSNEQNADIFISVHIDNVPKNECNTKSGLSVFIANDEIKNSEGSKLLASAIIESFENNYELPVAKKPLQRNVAIRVLKENKIPAILIEAGYLCNYNDLAYLQSANGQETFATNVLNAINNFAENKDAILNFEPQKPNVADTPIYYKGKKVKSFEISDKTQKVYLKFADKTKETISIIQALAVGITMPPPPPPPPLPPLPPLQASPISINELQEALSDSSSTIILLKGKQIDRELGIRILKNYSNNFTVYNKKLAYEKFGIETKNGLIDIIKQGEKMILEK